MSRPFTLFTGQWADLPLEEICQHVKDWGYDGLELACWGDHFDVQRALTEDGYLAGRHELLAKYDLKCWAISNHLTGQAVIERRPRLPAVRDRRQQVGRLVRERVLPAEHVPGRPPGRQVRMAGLGDQDGPEAGRGGVVGPVAELQLVQPFQVEGEAAAVAVELDPQLVLAPGGEPGRLECGQRARGQPGREYRGIVHGHRTRAAAARPRPLAHERGGGRGHPGDQLAGQVLSQVDDVRAQVAQRA